MDNVVCIASFPSKPKFIYPGGGLPIFNYQEGTQIRCLQLLMSIAHIKFVGNLSSFA